MVKPGSKAVLEVKDMQGKMIRGLWVMGLAVAFGVSAVASTATSAYDAGIRTAVTQKLQSKSELRGVQSSVEEAIVTLTGTVASYPDKLEAAKKAKVDHVAGVRNLIEVNAPAVADADLQAKVAKSLAYDNPYFDSVFNVLGVSVQNGVVTVSGEVRMPSDKDSALATVAHTKGVRDVIDQVKVAPLSNYDDELRMRVARAIYRDPEMARYAMDPQAPIRILVDNGHVGLYGEVDSQMDSTMAFLRASGTVGAFSVENHLQVAGKKTS
jgi:hyperosmotically inducible periplasmic protein